MSIAVVAPRAVDGGAERALTSLTASLASAGHELQVVVGEDGPLVGWLRSRAVPCRVGFDMLDEVVASAGVVVGWSDHGHLAAGPVAARLSRPAVWWRTLTWRDRPYERAAAAVPAAVVVCLSEAGARAQRVVTPGIPARAVSPGVPVEAIARRRVEGEDIRRRLGWQDCVVAGMVARLDPIKGQDLFLRAAAVVTTRCPTARFVVVGSDTLGYEQDVEAELHALARDLGLDGRVHFEPQVDDPVPWHAALDVAVNASTHEAFGLSIVEAMALGVPVVASRSDGPTEILRDGQDGVLFDVGDDAALAAVLERLLTDDAERDRFGRRAAARAQRFSEEETRRQAEAVLALARSRSPDDAAGRARCGPTG
jgi:glycosyltransferase involved in cell wall biosynthesis